VEGRITTVDVEASPIDMFRSLLDAPQWDTLEETMAAFARAMRGRRLWNINSTARGGGVAELLSSLIPYDRGCGIDERWIVIDGSPSFFNFTKRLHNLLHGLDGAGVDLTEADRQLYETTLDENARAVEREIRPGDVALLHDPQTIGLVPPLARRGIDVLWRCHIGVDEPNDAVRSAWRFLTPYLAPARAFIFSRAQHAWDGLDPAAVHVIAPTIGPFTTKNRDLPDREVAAILEAAGIMRTARGSRPSLTFDRQASITGEPLPPDAATVVQVSRWDRLKDPVGVLDAFALGIAPATRAHLVLAGPAVSGVDDDPEQPEVLNSVASSRESLPPDIRDRVLIVQLPMVNMEENAAMVNALQRHAVVVVQKSLAEGFGLTVAEAMWKTRPIVASRVGGIEDQIENDRSGLLIDDPLDLNAFASAVNDLLNDPRRASELGQAARRRAIAHFIAPRHLVEQARLVMWTEAA
jgi:trehalose synthase